MNRAPAVLVLGLTVLAQAPALAVQPPQPAPQFQALAAQRGKVVLVDFWASWCPPCRQALQAYGGLRAQFGGRGFEVIAVDLDQRPDQGLAVLRSLRLPYPQVQDPQGGIAERYGVPGMPASYLIDRHGRVRQARTGYDDSELEPLRGAVAQLVGEK